MSLIVHGFPHSPFCLAIESALRAFQVPFESKFVPPWDRSEILRLTHGHGYEVPVLEHDDRVIYESSGDSQDVAHYIDGEFGDERLFPNRLQGRHELLIRYLEHEVEDVTFRLFDPHYVDTIDDVANRGMLIRHKERKFGRGCIERWRQEHGSLAETAAHLLCPLDSMLHTDPFLFGTEPVFADFLLSGILGNITFSGFNPLPARMQRLAAFQKRMAEFQYAAAAVVA